MPDQDNQNPKTGSESDISKSQSQQQPPSQASQQQGESGQQGNEELRGDQPATGEDQAGAGPDENSQGDTMAQQRTDIEGASLQSPEKGEPESGFVGSQGQQDTSSELVDEEDKDFGKDGQGAPEGK